MDKKGADSNPKSSLEDMLYYSVASRKILDARHGVVNLAKRKLGDSGHKWLDQANTSAKKKITESAVNLAKKKLGDAGNRFLDHASTKAKQKMTDIFGKDKETKSYMNNIPLVL